jgi:c-di-GMP-related signal transduction protein
MDVYVSKKEVIDDIMETLDYELQYQEGDILIYYNSDTDNATSIDINTEISFILKSILKNEKVV